MEQATAEFFCRQFLNEPEMARLAFEAASRDPAWKEAVALSREKNRAGRPCRGEWEIETESCKMQDLFEAFDQAESPVHQTQEQLVLCKEIERKIQSVRFTYRIRAWFWCCGSGGAEDVRTSDFVATLNGPDLTSSDYNEIMALLQRSDGRRFQSIVESLHDALLEILTESVWKETSEQALDWRVHGTTHHQKFPSFSKK